MITIEKQIQSSYDLLFLINPNYVIQDTHVFYDEPNFPFYSAYLDNSSENQFSDYIISRDRVVAGALSATSKKIALLKALNESIERFCLYCTPINQIIYKSYEEISDKAFHPYFYTNPSSKKIGWIKGMCKKPNKPVFVPAQMVFLNYYNDVVPIKNPNEPILSQSISTGAAVGQSKEEAVLRGILEIIERDAVMSNYLNKISSPKIDLYGLRDKTLSYLLEKIKRYQFSLSVFDVTSDIPIPTFLSILIDNSGIYPTLTVGSKSDLCPISAIVGSIEESFMGRTWIRYEIQKKKNIFGKKAKMSSRLDRALYWSDKRAIDKFSYLLKNKPTIINEQRYHSFKKVRTKKNLLKIIFSLLDSLGYKSYYCDIKPIFIKTKDLFVIKVVIPGLQPLYFDEKNKNINIGRLKKVAQFFSKKRFKINEIPHPFL